jgi:hypothetical protein
MNILITERQKKMILETVTNNEEKQHIGDRVMVYYNLHKHTFSVRYDDKVFLHADYVKLGDVEFRVRKGGKEMVRQTEQKNVHAFVIGNLLDYCEFPCENIPNEPLNNVVTYDPYKYDSFVYKGTEEPVYKAKEVDMINQKNKLFVINEINSDVLSESDEIEGVPTKYTYITLGLFEKFKTKRYYFNKIVPVKDESPIPNKIKLEGIDGDFIFNKNDIYFKDQSAYIDKSSFDNQNPNFTLKNQQKLSSFIGITSSNVREALEKAFPENWNEQDKIFTPGLRGVYTIGEKTNDPLEDWSIMNYFDTKDEIHSLLYLKYFDDLKEGKEINDIVEWMSDLFKNDDEYTRMLVDRQWDSVKNGLELERLSVKNFLDKVGSDNVTYYPHGSKMDRWNGVDVTINGVNYQIKPLKTFNEEDGKYYINTYGMRDYKNKKSVNKIAFSSRTKVIVFDNYNYDVLSKNKAVFNEEPLIID